MSFLVLKAYLKLLHFDLYLASGRFEALHRKVRSHPVTRTLRCRDAIDRTCRAVDTACIWYWKHALCLQRSAVATCLLRDYGLPAQLVIGVQQLPFRAHAWVEIEGHVANDKAHIVKEQYKVLDRL